MDSGLPDRWLECPQFGEVIPDSGAGNRFIPLKTPLDDHINVPPGYSFTPEIFIEQMKQKKLDVGLLINLTFTNRYYDPNQIIDDLGIQFKQISCRGHNQPPQPNERNEFIKVCRDFFSKNPRKIIAVHCTHGFNRTGFMICSYLFQECDWEITAAIETFAQKRYPGIYKQDYVSQLFKDYGDEDDPVPEAPPRPVWDAGVITEDKPYVEPSIFYEGINDVTLVRDKALVHKIYRHCCNLCRFGNDGAKTVFPGGQPVSLDRGNISYLSENPYRVSWKADGCRYMLYIQDESNMFFLTRNLDMWRVTGLRFPKLNDLNQDLRDTLVDGEMVTDVEPKSGQKIPRYLIYDVICFDGNNAIAQDDFDKRSWIIKNVMVQAREKAKYKKIIISEREPFRVREKKFFNVQMAKGTWEMPVSHEKDGLIFQPLKDPYIGGTCTRILKWKPPSLNSIDFKIRITTQKKEGCLPEEFIGLHVSNKTDPVITLRMDKSKADFRQYDGKIVEMSIPDRKTWKILRERTDKTTPNSEQTALAVIQSIKFPVTEENLFEYIAKNCPAS